MTRRTFRITVVLAATALIAACERKSPSEPPSVDGLVCVVCKVDVTPSQLSVKTGVTSSRSAHVESGHALPDSLRGVRWNSSDTTIASVDAFGGVTGIQPGTATIAAHAVADPYVWGESKVVVSAQ